MPKLLTKKWIFSFLINFVITFIVGFFAWNIFINKDNDILNQVLGEASKVGSKLFSASILPGYNENKDARPTVGLTLSTDSTDYDVAVDQSPVLDENQDRQDLLDDIQEKLDIISNQVQTLIAEQNSVDKSADTKEEKPLEEKTDQNQGKNINETAICAGQINLNTAHKEDLQKIIGVGPVTAQKIITARPFYSLNDLLKVNGIGAITLQKIISQGCAYVDFVPVGGGSSGGGSLAQIVYPKILISEVQVMPIAQRFIELYNPNNQDIDLTNWYLQRKTETGSDYSSFVSKNNFLGKQISANGYFLISREIENSDILSDITLSDNNSLVFKNPNGDISDKLGFGSAFDFELLATVSPSSGQSIGRKWDSTNNVEQDTDDNSADFELDSPTPKAQNIKYVEQPVLPAPNDIIAPQVTFNIEPSQTGLTFPVNFTITDPIAGAVSPSGINSYIFRWQIDSGTWQQDASVSLSGGPSSTALSRNFTGENGKTYNFQVQATDLAGNVSDWLPTTTATTAITVPVVQKNILITDIQTEGQKTSDDFIRLYNPNASDIFLEGYRLVKRAETSAKDTTIKSWSRDASSKIPGMGYYLWASSTDENYPSLVRADTFTKQNISSNNGIALRNGPEDTGEIIDAVGWGNFDNVLFEANSFLQNPDKNQTLSRIKIGEDYQDENDNSSDFSLIDTVSPTNY